MRTRTLGFGLTALLALGCGDSGVVVPEADQTPPFAAAQDVTPQTVEGSLGPGALYRMTVPPGWNGGLVLYAHGYVGPDEEVTLDLDVPEAVILSTINSMGIATAYSSFSENGLAVKDGAQRTKQLRGIFVSNFGQPAKTMLVGGSLGGLIAVKLAETFPKHYVGALALCGPIGGSQAAVDYFAHLRVLFDVFYPGLIPGDLFNPPETEAEKAFYLAQVQAELFFNPGPAQGIVAVMAAMGMPIPGETGPQLGRSILTAIDFNFYRFEDVLARTHGHSFFDNWETVYPQPLIPIDVNATVDRFKAKKDALNYLRKYYQPTGDLQVPVATVHELHDPVAPVFHEALYGAMVAAAGNNILQLTANAYGHCSSFELAPVALAAFDYLTTVTDFPVGPVF